MGTNPEDMLPLTPVAFEVLLALTAGAAHGYAILRAVEARSAGTVSLHAGRAEEGGDERRRYYALTPLGRSVARAEALRLEAQVGAARAHGLLGGAGSP